MPRIVSIQFHFFPRISKGDVHYFFSLQIFLSSKCQSRRRRQSHQLHQSKCKVHENSGHSDDFDDSNDSDEADNSENFNELEATFEI